MRHINTNSHPFALLYCSITIFVHSLLAPLLLWKISYLAPFTITGLSDFTITNCLTFIMTELTPSRCPHMYEWVCMLMQQLAFFAAPLTIHKVATQAHSSYTTTGSDNYLPQLIWQHNASNCLDKYGKWRLRQKGRHRRTLTCTEIGRSHSALLGCVRKHLSITVARLFYVL